MVVGGLTSLEGFLSETVVHILYRFACIYGDIVWRADSIERVVVVLDDGFRVKFDGNGHNKELLINGTSPGRTDNRSTKPGPRATRINHVINF